MYFVFDFLDDRSPHERSKGFFSYGDAQIDEMSPIMVDRNVEDLGYVSKSSHIAIPAIELTFIQICKIAKGTKEEFERS